MAEAGHMVKINEDYGPKGLVFIGVSLDQDGAAMKNVAKEKNFTWPQFFDGQGWGTSWPSSSACAASRPPS